MIFRFAEKNDIETLVRLRFDFFASDPALTLTEAQREAVQKQLPDYYVKHLNCDFFAALAEDDIGSLGSIAACSFLVVQEKPANYRFPSGKTGLVLNVFTYPEYRLQGCATGTLKLLIGKAASEGLSLLELSATEAGAPVYRKLGFTENPPAAYTEMTLTL
jgi:GNAT superfamily N-acetyltransferase